MVNVTVLYIKYANKHWCVTMINRECPQNDKVQWCTMALIGGASV